eukprot:1158256-Pelagomonas_calceolata.AAC.9
MIKFCSSASVEHEWHPQNRLQKELIMLPFKNTNRSAGSRYKARYNVLKAFSLALFTTKYLPLQMRSFNIYPGTGKGEPCTLKEFKGGIRDNTVQFYWSALQGSLTPHAAIPLKSTRKSLKAKGRKSKGKQRVT